MLLVNYEYYSKKYGGSSIPESSFNSKVIEASKKINYYTHNRIKELDDNISFLICQIAELLFEQEELRNKLNCDKKEISGETLGPHSISYVNKSNSIANQILSDTDLEKKIYKMIYQSLVYTGLMDRGIYE